MKKVLIIGSNGWLASRIAAMLKERKGGAVVIRGFDILPCKPGVAVDEFVQGDLTSKADVTKAMQGVDTVFHVAAIVNGSATLLNRVNVLGVENSLACAQAAGAKSFIYTSTASVAYNGVDLHNGTEDLPYTTTDLDPYTITKSKAEALVLSKNGVKGVYTCALRPHSIYGPGDDISWPQMLASAAAGKLKWKLTDDVHKSSYTYLDNIVHGELLAADKLIDPVQRGDIAGKAYNINDDIEALFWTKTYDVAELSGVPKNTYGRIRLPFFSVIYYISWLLWWVGYPLGTFTPYVLCLATTTHTYSCAKAKKELGYAPVMPHAESWKITKDSFKNWKNTYRPKKTPKLSLWLTFVGLLSLFGSAQAFWSLDLLKSRQFSLQPDQVTGVAGRLFGAWTLVATLVRFACAFDLENKTLFRTTLQTFYIALGFYASECFVFGTVPFLNAIPPFLVASVSILWMNRHRRQ